MPKKTKKNRGGGCEIIDCNKLPINQSREFNDNELKKQCIYFNGNREQLIQKYISDDAIEKGIGLPKGSDLQTVYSEIINDHNYCKNNDNNVIINNNTTNGNNNNNTNNTTNDNINTIKPNEYKICEKDVVRIPVGDTTDLDTISKTIKDKVTEISKCNNKNTKLRITNDTTSINDKYAELYNNLLKKQYLHNTTTLNPYYIQDKQKKYIIMDEPKKTGGTKKRKTNKKTKTNKRKTNKRKIKKNKNN